MQSVSVRVENLIFVEGSKLLFEIETQLSVSIENIALFLVSDQRIAKKRRLITLRMLLFFLSAFCNLKFFNLLNHHHHHHYSMIMTDIHESVIK